MIAESRQDAGFDVTWGVALVSFSGVVSERILGAQAQVIAEDPPVFEGPMTDDLIGPEWRYDGIHFNEPGLREHARRWMEAILDDCCGGPRRPWAALTMSSATVEEEEELALNAEGDRTLVAWEWDFGDGSTGVGVTTTHSYASFGRYDVALRVTDSEGNTRSIVRNVTVTIRPQSVSPWKLASVGATGFGHGERFVGGDCVVMGGGGNGVRGGSDEFRFLYQERKGSFSLTARLAEFEPSGEHASVGLFIRENLEKSAKQLGILRRLDSVVSSLEARVRKRQVSSLGERIRGSTAPWLRLERIGATLEARYSDDGAAWSELWRGELELGDPVLVGLAVTSDDTARDGLPTFATFCDVSLEDLERSFVRGDCNSDGQAVGTVSDAVFLLGFLFLGHREPDCLAACDGDGDGEVVATLQDAFYLLNFSFGVGAPPPAPFPECGPGGDADAHLGCRAPPDCF